MKYRGDGVARSLHEAAASPIKGIHMKASKFIVLLGGILGILAFFLPMVAVDRPDAKGTVSAFELIKGVDQAQAAVDREPAYASMRESSSGPNMGALKGIVVAIFVPALFLFALGGLGVARKKFGRAAGIVSLIFGVIGLAIAGLLSAAASGDSGIGLTLLIVTGLLGLVGGILATAKPERGLQGLATA